MKLQFFRELDDYNDFLFWRSEHQRLAATVIIISLVSIATPYILNLFLDK